MCGRLRGGIGSGRVPRHDEMWGNMMVLHQRYPDKTLAFWIEMPFLTYTVIGIIQELIVTVMKQARLEVSSLFSNYRSKYIVKRDICR